MTNDIYQVLQSAMIITNCDIASSRLKDIGDTESQKSAESPRPLFSRSRAFSLVYTDLEPGTG